jgi:2-polyprenyl-6-methoxyphenol hydroxylase-like FAD-dependent oxidoreductase
MVADVFPPFWQDVIDRTPAAERFIQPMYDMVAPSYAEGRLVLLGDAASVARPHTGSGAIKALQDATVLSRTLAEADTLEAALRAYDGERAPVGRAVVRLGRSLGLAQVEQTPDWSAMDQRAMEEWWQGQGGGAGFGGHALSRGERAGEAPQV